MANNTHPGCRLAQYAFLASLVGSLPAAAGQQATLRGLSETSVNVSHDMTDADRSCGIRQEDVKPVVSAALTEKGLKVVDDSAFAELLVNFITLETDGTCVTSVRLGLRGWATATLMYDPKKEPKVSPVFLREESTMLLSSARQHGERFRDRVGALAERIATAVRSENQ